MQHLNTVLKAPKNTSPISLMTHSLSHTHTNRFLFLKYHDEHALYPADRLLWQDLTGSAQGLSVYLNEPVKRRDLTNLAPEKNSSAPPGQIVIFSAVFPLFIEVLWGGMP